MPTTADYVNVAGNSVTASTPGGGAAGGGVSNNENTAAAYANMLVAQGMTPEAAAASTNSILGNGGTSSVSTSPAAAAGGGMGVNTPGVPDWVQNWDSSQTDWRGNTPGWSQDATGSWRYNGPLGAQGGGGTSPAAGAGTPDLNIPAGAAYYGPLLGLIGQMLGYGTTAKTAAAQLQQQQADTLAKLRAQPLSAAEEAFRRAGMGLDPFAAGGGALDVQKLITSPTDGGSQSNSVDFGNGQVMTLPGTLSGAQLSALKGMPNTQDALSSFATAGGDPDLIARSVKAMMPALFGTGSLGFGTQAGFGAGTGLM